MPALEIDDGACSPSRSRSSSGWTRPTPSRRCCRPIRSRRAQARAFAQVDRLRHPPAAESAGAALPASATFGAGAGRRSTPGAGTGSATGSPPARRCSRASRDAAFAFGDTAGPRRDLPGAADVLGRPLRPRPRALPATAGAPRAPARRCPPSPTPTRRGSPTPKPPDRTASRATDARAGSTGPDRTTPAPNACSPREGNAHDPGLSQSSSPAAASAGSPPRSASRKKGFRSDRAGEARRRARRDRRRHPARPQRLPLPSTSSASATRRAPSPSTSTISV